MRKLPPRWLQSPKRAGLLLYLLLAAFPHPLPLGHTFVVLLCSLAAQVTQWQSIYLLVEEGEDGRRSQSDRKHLGSLLRPMMRR